jgi:hypothetical protein
MQDSATPTSADILVALACGLVVAFYAAKRYNTPDTNRLSTTRSLFLVTGAGYVVASVCLFALLSEIILKPGILTFLGVDHAQEVVAKYSAPPVLAALLLTTLLPNTALISEADHWLLKSFQDWGRIPHGVRNLADDLTPKAMPVTESDLVSLRAWINAEADVPSELSSRVSTDVADTSRGKLTRALRSFYELEQLKVTPDYAHAFRRQRDAWERIVGDFRVFAAQSHAFFVLFDQLAAMEGPAGQDALKNSRDCYSEICGELHEKMAEFLAQLLLMVEASDARIKSRLENRGFSISEPTCPPLPIGALAFLGVMMIIGILLIVAVVPSGSSRLPMAIIAMLIGTTQTIGLLTAILPKLRCDGFRSDSRGNYPYLGWLETAILAGLIALVLDRTAMAINAHAFGAELDFAHFPMSPMGPMASAISLSVSVLCDIDFGLGQGWLRRVSEGMLCGAAMVIAIFICIHLLDLPPATKGQIPTWFPFVFSFGLGFTSGFIGPHLYRRARGGEEVHLNPILRHA